MKTGIFCENLDTKQRAFIDTLFFKDERISEAKSLDEADFVALLIEDAERIADICRDKGIKRFIVLDLADTGEAFIDFSRSLRGYFRRHGLTVICLKLQIYDQDYYNFFKDDQNIIVLSLPLLLGGSTKYIMDEDHDASSLFENNLVKNERKYEYDYSWIGAITSIDRHRALSALSVLKEYRSYIRVTAPGIKISGFGTENLAPVPNSLVDNTRIPHADMMRISRVSKINLSLNGYGMWCLRDGELFSRNCFDLRQYHPNLNINPLTPRDGVHWVVFNDKNMLEKIEYYLRHDDEREAVNDRGHEYFKRGITGEWARYYVDRLIKYIDTGDKKVFEALLVYDRNLDAGAAYRLYWLFKELKRQARNIEDHVGIAIKLRYPRLYRLIKKIKNE